MATWTRRTIRSTREEWVVPTGPWGATLGDIRAALTAASVAYRETHGLPQDYALPDDALRFHATDDEIVISFTTEEPDRG